MLPNRLILNFHGLGEPARPIDDAERPYWLPVSAFASALDCVPTLRARGIDLEFTFDDGNLSDFAHAFPLLTERGRTARFFLLAGRIGKPGSLSKKHVREMSEAGMTIGSHGWDHVDWRQASVPQLKRELRESRARLQDISGKDVDEAAVPFGLFDARTTAEVWKAGYRSLFTSSGGFATRRPGLTPRISVTSRFDPERDLRRLLTWRTRFDSLARAVLRRLKYPNPAAAGS